MKKKPIFWIVFFCSVQIFSQENAKIDSLKTLFSKENSINKKTKLLNLLGHTFEGQSNLDSALYYYTAAKDFAIKNHYDIGVASFDFHLIMILNKQGKFREAFDLAVNSVEEFKKLNSPENLAIAYINLGGQWQYISDFKKASEYYLMAKEILDSTGDQNNQRLVNNNLGSVFLEMKEFEKVEQYCHRAIALADKQHPTHKLLPLNNLALSEKKQNKFDLAQKYIEEYEKIAIEAADEYYISNGYITKASIIGLNNMDEGVRYLHESINLSLQNDFPENEMLAYLALAEIYIYHKKFERALLYIQKGIPIAKRLNTRYELADFYKKASEAYENLKNFKNALKYNRMYEDLIYEIQINDSKNQILALEAQYHFKEKAAEIKTLSAEKEAQTLKIRQKNSINFALAGILVIAGIIGFLVYKNHQNRQRIQAQRIYELETEKQLSATQALLQGQEDERSRVAKELHDGLGGLLSGVKLNLNNMQKKLIITEEDGAAFEKSIHLLDESIGELRRVAHNLMPESILKFGLDGAISEFLQSLINENLNIIYQSYHIENGLGKQLDISVYRIIQELVNNSIKHSEASEILVQVRKDEPLLVIDVEDNGKGFDVKSIEKESGMGLWGIRSRVGYWKGKLEIDSGQDSGTVFHIEIPIG